MYTVIPSPSTSLRKAPSRNPDAKTTLGMTGGRSPSTPGALGLAPPIMVRICMSLDKVIEALLFSAQKPLSIHEITAAIKAAEGDQASDTPNEFARVKNAEVAAALEQLKVEYIQQSRAFQLVEKAEGWQLATDPDFAKWVRQLFPAPTPARLSAPSLEACPQSFAIATKYPCGRRSGARREHRWRAANVDGARYRENRRTCRNPGTAAPLRNDTIFPRSLRSTQSRRIAERRRVAKTYLPVAQPVAGIGDAGGPGSSPPAATNL